jgi:hypothetical protein
MLTIGYYDGTKSIIHTMGQGEIKIIGKNLPLKNPHLCRKWHLYSSNLDHTVITKYDIISEKIIKTYTISNFYSRNGMIVYYLNGQQYYIEDESLGNSNITVDTLGKYFVLKSEKKYITFSCTCPGILSYKCGFSLSVPLKGKY